MHRNPGIGGRQSGKGVHPSGLLIERLHQALVDEVSEAHADRSLMELLRALLLAQSNGRHLHESALNTPMKAGVRLDPIYQHDSIRAGGVPVLIENEFAGATKFDGLHAAAEGHTYSLLGNAVPGEDIELACIGCAAMTAHGGNDEDLGAEALQFSAD